MGAETNPGSGKGACGSLDGVGGEGMKGGKVCLNRSFEKFYLNQKQSKGRVFKKQICMQLRAIYGEGKPACTAGRGTETGGNFEKAQMEGAKAQGRGLVLRGAGQALIA